MNDATQVRLVSDGRILLGAYGIPAPTGLDWTPGINRTDIGYYSEDGFELTPEPGDNKTFIAHNEDVVIDIDAAGNWTVAFSGIEQKKEVIETYFDAQVNETEGSITVSGAAVKTFRDLVTIGIAGDDELIITHYPRVKLSDRESLTYNASTMNQYGMTFKTYKDPVLGYDFKQWSTFLKSSAAVIPTITATSPVASQVEAGNVIITGTNFGAVTNVKFGAAQATFTINSATQITAIMPAGAAGTANLTLTNSGGTTTPHTFARA